MDSIDEISDDKDIQGGVLVAWALARTKFPADSDFAAILLKESAATPAGWQIYVVPRRIAIAMPKTPKNVKRALAVPAGDQEPRFPLKRAIWLVVFVDNIFKGSMRMVDPINAGGGSA